MRRIVTTGLAAIALTAIAGCGSSSTSASSHHATASTTAPAATTAKVQHGHATVAVTNYAFHPASISVTPGTKITFTNHDQTAHTATANGGAFDTGTINPGQSKTITVKKAGSYPYHCVFHAFMTGTVKVVKG